MKRSIIILVLLAFISFICTVGVMYINYSIAELNTAMESTIEYAKKNDLEKANEMLLQTEKLWHKHRKILMMYIEQDLLDDVDNQMALLKALMLYHEEEFLPQAILCISQLEEIQQRETISCYSWF